MREGIASGAIGGYQLASRRRRASSECSSETLRSLTSRVCLAMTLRLRSSRSIHAPVIARISADRVVLDPRTVLPEQDRTLTTALSVALVK